MESISKLRGEVVQLSALERALTASIELATIVGLCSRGLHATATVRAIVAFEGGLFTDAQECIALNYIAASEARVRS